MDVHKASSSVIFYLILVLNGYNSKNKMHLVSSGLVVGWENSVLQFQFFFILVLFVLMIATPYNQLVKTNHNSLTGWK